MSLTFDTDEDFDFDAEPVVIRCEIDHKDGGVCQRVLTLSGHCPGAADHAEVPA